LKNDGIEIEKLVTKLSAEIETISNETQNSISILSDHQRLWSPKPGKWSIAHCFSHLVTTGDLYFPRIKNSIELSMKTGIPGLNPLYKPGLISRFFIYSVGPKAPYKIKTFKKFRPSATPSPLSPEEFLVQQKFFLELLATAKKLNPQGLKIPSPQTRFVKFTLGECLEMLVAHQRRHLNQIKSLLQSSLFPPR